MSSVVPGSSAGPPGWPFVLNVHFPPHQFSVPPEQRLRPDDERRQQRPRQCPARRSQERLVQRRGAVASPSAEAPHLMAEDQDFDISFNIGPTTCAEDAPEQQI